MLISCKCLNVVIRYENGFVNNIEIDKLELSPLEQRDPFFAETLSSASKWNIQCEELSLVEARNVGAWAVHLCLVCRTHTHASHMQPPHRMLVNAVLATTEQKLADMRQSERFSTVFKILVDVSYDETLSDKRTMSSVHPGVGSLNKRLTRALQAEVEAVEEAVRLFREKKYSQFQQFKDQAHRDHRILAGLISSRADNVQTSLPNINRNASATAMSEDAPQQIPLSAKARHQPSRGNIKIKPKNISKNLVTHGSYKEDSLDSEGIFDLEGMDSSTPPHDGDNSDAYESDTDDSVSRDEGIHIKRNAAQPWNSNIAKSLPVSVPAFAHLHDLSQDGLNLQDEEPQDIAASIKALARSVHEDVFGDLPRPRFSTQI